MHKKTVSLFFNLICFFLAYSQKASYVHPSTLGVHFFVNDFKANQVNGVANGMEPGIGLGYVKGLSPHFDWQAKVNASFSNRTLKERPHLEDKSLLLQMDASLRSRLMGQKSWVTPFTVIGVGASAYKAKYAMHIPLGVGLEFNYKDAFLSFGAQYHLPLLGSFNRQLFYSIGLTGVVSKGNRKKQVRTASINKLVPTRDSDGDGLVDSEDTCPDRAGLALFRGCPDSDGDGIEDSQDKCPSVMGIVRYKGCPVPDSDMDGINDEQDSCANSPGLARFHGCPPPDSDADGVSDEEDRCLNLFGVRENHGCPLVKEELTEQMKKAARNLFFQTGSYRLLEGSLPALNNIVAILRENTGLKLTIEGHTDNQGTAIMNQALSENRARAVASYLIGKGIHESRLQAVGFGSTKPIADNNTEQGRSENRRVELKLYY